MNKNEILGRIKTISTRGAGLDKLIQETALGVIAHVEEHGEVSLACKLYKAMPKGSRSVALASWLTTFGKIQINTDKKQSAEFPFLNNRNGTTDIAGGTAKAWFDCKKTKTLAEEFDFESKLAAFQKLIRKQLESGNVAVDDRVSVLLGMEVKTVEKKAA